MNNISNDHLKNIKKKPFLTTAPIDHLSLEHTKTQVQFLTAIDAFKKQVTKTPNYIALEHNDDHLSYHELDSKSDQLAKYILEKSKINNHPIAIYMERNLEIIIAMIAILKSGHSFLLIAQDLPKNRIKEILSNCQAELIISNLTSFESKKIPTIYYKWHDNLNNKKGTLPTIDKKDLAYIIYTSGSTGQPKGVMISHENLQNIISDSIKVLSISQSDNFLSITNVSFDIFIWEVFISINSGSTLKICHKETMKDSKKIADQLNMGEISNFFATPSLWSQIVNHLKKDIKIEKSFCGGEKLSSSLAKKIMRFSNNVWNLYGPSETTMWSAYSKINDRNIKYKSIPIEMPFANTKLILKESNQKNGELYIGGKGLAKGYLKQPELTKEKFIVTNNERLYKTGDIFKKLDNGGLEYAGRLDNQIKLNGQRIETEEIEHYLLKIKSIKQCAVLFNKKNGRLSAYLATKNNEINPRKIQDHLKRNIPHHMIPSSFIILDKMPLTINGKIDTKNLTKNENILFSNAYIPPKNKMDKLIVNIFHKKLKIPMSMIGIDHNFYEMGGNSLSAMEIISSINSKLNTNINIIDFFKNPTIKNTIRLINDKKCNKKENIAKESHQNLFPLSPTQERLWFMTKKINQECYHSNFIIKINGEVDTKWIDKTIKSITIKHDILRSIIFEKDGNTYQKISSHYIKAKKTNLSAHLSDTEKMKSIRKESRRYFDFSLPAWRVIIYKISNSSCYLSINMHHIITDGISQNIFIKDFIYFYQSYIKRIMPEVKKPTIQYQDFSTWQKKLINSGKLAPQLNYWKKALNNYSELKLPHDYKRPAVNKHRGRNHYFPIHKQTYEKLLLLAKNEKTTLFNVLSVTFFIALYQYSGQEDMIIGTPIANRKQKEIKNLIGFFVNMLPIRCKIDPKISIKGLIKQQNAVNISAYQNQDIPFDRIIREMNLQGINSYNPLFQVAINLEPESEKKFSINNTKISIENIDPEASIFDILLSFEQNSSKLSAKINYNSELFHPSSIERLAKNFRRIAAIICNNPQKSVESVSTLVYSEKNKILTFNKKNNHHPVAKNTVIDLFEQQVRNYPRKIAICYNEKRISYQSLNNQVNQMANYINDIGIKKGSLIAVHLTRDISLIISILAILKSGNGYIPLSSQIPEKRVKEIIKDSKAKLLVTEKILKDKMEKDDLEKFVLLEDIKEKLKFYPKENLNIKLSSEKIAYIIYTSGTTGKPKGVMISHGNVSHLIDKAVPLFDFKNNDTWSFLHSSSFDFSVWEMFGSLCTGAKLEIVPYCVTKSLDQLYQLIIDKKITVLNITPSAFYQLSHIKEKGNAHSSLRYVIFGGENLDCKKIKTWNKKMSFVNMYGITETTVHATYHKISQQDKNSFYTPIGHPLPDCSFYVLNDKRQLVPIGTIGELYIGGSGVAKGYLNQKKLTQERFINNPFKSKHTTLYKTGDLVRRNHQGNLEYIARNDRQVKLRGYRIELDEIKTSLSHHPHIDQTVVITKNENEDQYIAAYLVPKVSGKNINLSGEFQLWQNEKSDHWHSVFDSTYSEEHCSELKSDIFNITGWKSSYTGDYLPASEMQEWVETTINRILTLKPKKVLEIGCGTGLMLFRIAPTCQHYQGYDFSQTALDYIQQNLAKQKLEKKVSLALRSADQINEKEKYYDTVIINSVIQYFPSLNYFIDVIEKSIASIVDGGHVFIGDIRNFQTISLFHQSIKLYQSKNESYQQWQESVTQAILQDEELLISPDFFYAYAKNHSRISHVNIEIKRGRSINEMTQFRYDVTLSINKETKNNIFNQATLIEWPQQPMSAEEISTHLSKQKPDALIIRHIANTQLSRIQENIAASHEMKQLVDVKQLAPLPSDAGIFPEDLWQLAEKLPYRVSLSCSANSQSSEFDAVFIQKQSNNEYQPISDKQEQITDWNQYANQPLWNKLHAYLVPQLREYLRQRLPEYMIPSFFILLPNLPLNTNGKIDYRALPNKKIIIHQQHVPAKTTTEKKLQSIWQKLLAVDNISICDDFFELGGHSLLAVRLIADINEQMGKQLKINDLFTHPSIKKLSQLVEEHIINPKKLNQYKPAYQNRKLANPLAGSKIPLPNPPADKQRERNLSL